MRQQSGFTLIESLIYLGLFAIIMVGVVAVAYSTFEASGRLQTKALIQEEGDFLMAKINWALSGATSVTVVSLPSTPRLTIIRTGNPLIIDFDENLKMNGSPLNNSNLIVTGLNYINTGNGTPIESVITSFTLQSNTPNGQVYSQDFQTTKYLRK